MDDLDEIDARTAATHTAARRYVTMRAIMHEVMLVGIVAVMAALAAFFFFFLTPQTQKSPATAEAVTAYLAQQAPLAGLMMSVP